MKERRSLSGLGIDVGSASVDKDQEVKEGSGGLNLRYRKEGNEEINELFCRSQGCRMKKF